MSTSHARDLRGGDVQLRRAAVNTLAGDEVEVEGSSVGRINAREIEIERTALGLAVADRMEIKRSNAGALVARDVQAREVRALFLLSPRVSGTVRTVFDMRAAFAFGLGIVLGGRVLKLLRLN